MSCQKRKGDKEGTEISKSNTAKRQCLQQSPSSPFKRNADEVPSSNLRVYSVQEKERVLEILESEFEKELQAKEEEALEIQERIIKTQKILQYLCYAVVSDFYSREKTITSVASTRQRRIHPAVKKLLSGKGPPGAPELHSTISASGTLASTSACNVVHADPKDDDILAYNDSPTNHPALLPGGEKKVPRYIPPKPKPKPIGNQSEPVRGGQNKIKTILLVGNVSKWLNADMRDDSATHKWIVYVRGPKDNPDISSFVSKVRFFLHPSYKPNDLVEVEKAPYQLARRGWGEFPIRVQVHFKNSLNKPVDIIHNLKLDRTYCGLQTYGSETVAEIWIYREPTQPNISTLEENSDVLHSVKIEHLEVEDNSPIISSEKAKASSLINLPELSAFMKNEEKDQPEDFGSTENIEQNLTNEIQISPSKSKSIISSLHSKSVSEIPTIIKMEPSLEKSRHEPLMMPSVASDADVDLKVGKKLSSSDGLVLSPSKSPSSSSLSRVSPSPQSSPTKLGVLNVTGDKPATQLVKYFDSKGAVRFLQVRTDLLPKIVKKGSATSPATPPVATEGSAKLTVTSSAVQPSSLCPPTQVMAQTPLQNPSQATSSQTSKVLPQTVVSGALSQNSIPKILPQSAVVQMRAQNCIAKKLSQSGSNQDVSLSTKPAVEAALPQNAVGRSAPRSLSNQVLAQTAMSSPVKIKAVPIGLSLSPRSRPILRLGRPADNMNARPLLVAANSTNQVFRLPPSAAANGNRPLYVLKDGQLFVMKSALDAATKGTPTPVLTVRGNVPDISSSANTVPTVPCSTLTLGRSPIISSAAKFSSLTTPTMHSDAISNGDDKVSENVPGTNSNNHPVTSVNAAALHRPRSTVSISPVIRFPSPQSAQGVIRTVSKNISTAAQSPNVSNSTHKVHLKPGKSLLKPAVSLLKSNIGAPVSAPIAPVNRPSQSKQPSSISCNAAPAETVQANKRIVLGRNAGSSTITPHSQQSMLYRTHLRSSVLSCPRGPQGDVLRAVRWMFKNIPLICSEAKHIEFKILHPYCAIDEKTFCSWNVGKQRACEWQRARMVHLSLKEAGWDIQDTVTIKDLVIWARTHGYTPGLPFMKNSLRSNISDGDEESTFDVLLASTRVTEVEEWLDAQDRLPHLYEARCLNDESDEEVDVISSNISPSKVKVKQEITSISENDVPEDAMAIEPNLLPIGDLVTNSLNKLGIKLLTEEIAPGTKYPAALRVLIQAVQSFVEDLGRRAYAEGWSEGNITCRPESIELLHASLALSHRPAFDIFTCAGLGIPSINDSNPLIRQ